MKHRLGESLLVFVMVLGFAFVAGGVRWSEAWATSIGDCEGSAQHPFKECFMTGGEPMVDCRETGSCYEISMVCPDGSCGENNAPCRYTEYTQTKKYGEKCDDASYYGGADCRMCSKYWCAEGDKYTARDVHDDCLNKKCKTIFHKANVCYQHDQQ